MDRLKENVEAGSPQEYPERACEQQAQSDRQFGVKEMVFLPSNRRLWSVVGRDREYWVDPSSEFCSCSDFYFSSLSGGEPCYHLDAVKRVNAKAPPLENESCSLDIFEFSDIDYSLILTALAADAEAILGSH